MFEILEHLPYSILLFKVLLVNILVENSKGVSKVQKTVFLAFK